MFRKLRYMAMGALIAYFFDPQMGKTRRSMARDRLGGMLRRTARRTGRWGRWAGAKGYGKWMKATHPVEQPNDHTPGQTSFA